MLSQDVAKIAVSIDPVSLQFARDSDSSLSAEQEAFPSDDFRVRPSAAQEPQNVNLQVRED